MNAIFLKALQCEVVPYTPIWIMRQAGRYLPEYRLLREKAGSFLQLCKTPELACEVTLQPLRRFGMDAGILFSDILTIPDAMGMELNFIEGEGPIFGKKLQTNHDIDQLRVPDPELDLGYVMQTIRLLKQELTVPLIGFAGSPWTIAAYMLEGKSPGDFKIAKGWLYTNPAGLHRLLSILAESITQYLAAQIEAGVDTIMIFDSWGGILTQAAYQEFSLAYMEQILENLKLRYPHIPQILFTKGGGAWLDLYRQSQATAIGLDWQTPIKQARAILGEHYVLQGNLDPAILRAPDHVIETEVKRILQDCEAKPGHIFNLGHGITPDIDPAKVKFLVDCVQAS